MATMIIFPVGVRTGLEIMNKKRSASSAPGARVLRPPASVPVPSPSSSHRRRFCLGASGATSIANIHANDDNKVEKEVTNEAARLDPKRMPKHVAFIPDGNGRWAKERGLPVEQGHRISSDTIGKLVSAAASKFHIKAFTAYIFSTENWNRSKKEIDLLMGIIQDFIQTTITDLILRHDLRFNAIGDIPKLPASLVSAISAAEELSRGNKGMQFVMTLSYSGHWDITQAAKQIACKVKDGLLDPNDIGPAVLDQHLVTSCVMDHGFRNPDLLIRTSGEHRLSNYFLWQMAYTEFYFLDKLFPDLDETDFARALESFQARNRRYGGRGSDDISASPVAVTE